MTVNNEIALKDVFFHLANLKNDFANHKIENNKNHLTVYTMNDFTNRIELVEQLIKRYDNHNLKLLTILINTALLKDPELHCLNVIIKKSKFLPHIDKSKTALIIYHI